MAKQTLAPFFVGTIDLLTFYKMYNRFFVRAKSSLTAERVKTDLCFIPTMQQAAFLSQASRIGSALYGLVPKEHKHHQLYRVLTGRANLLLKKGLTDDEILLRLIDSHIAPLKKMRVKALLKAKKTKRKKSNKACLPAYVRHCRRFKMIDEVAVAARPVPQGVLAAIVKEMASKGYPAPAWLLPDLPEGFSGLAS